MDNTDILIINKNQKTRNPTIDSLVTIFLSIVLFLHHNDFGFGFVNLINEQIISILIIFSVGGFVFISGYKLANSKTNISFIHFLINRFIKILPLYWISLILFYLFIQPGLGLNHLILHFFGMQIIFYNIFGAPFLTIYFIGLIFIYYLIFAITKKYLNNIIKFIIINACIFLIALYLHFLKPFGINLFEYRFFLYYIFFITGILVNNYKDKNKIFNSIIYIFPFIALFIYSQFYKINGLSELSTNFSLSYFYLIPSIIILFACLISIKLNLKKYSFIYYISYSSFLIFLFHRFIWYLFLIIWENFIKYFFIQNISHIPIEIPQYIFVNILGTIFLFIMSYWIQYFFDKHENNIIYFINKLYSIIHMIMKYFVDFR